MILLVLAAMCACGSIGVFVAQGLRARREVRLSLARASGAQSTAVDVSPGNPTRQRLTGMSERAGRIASVVTRGDEAELGQRLIHAGLASKLAPQEFLALKLVVGAGGAMLGLLVALKGGNPLSGVVLVAILAALGFVAPNWLLHARVRSRRESIRAALPSTLDLLAVSVEAGLGLDAAIARITATTKGPLTDELTLLLGRMSMGESRSDALRGLAERLDVPELTAFVRALLQTDKLGLSVGRTLRMQAAEVRSRRQAAVEEQAQKAPIKMMFPTVFFIFPALFVVVLGPVMLEISRTL